MDSGHRKLEMNVGGDRLSSLPDDLIHKILSFISIREAIEISVLSSRWKFIWKSMPYLKFSTHEFSTLPKFSKFVTNVLSRRDHLTDLYSLNLRFRVKSSYLLVKRILKYAFNHNIQQLNVVCFLESDNEFPLSLFSCQSLKHFSFTIQNYTGMRHVNSSFISTWELPYITTLDLCYVTLRSDNADGDINVFSKCANLKFLTLKHFNITGSNSLSIFHPQLSNLTLESCGSSETVVDVAAPQLKNLTLKFCYVKCLKISAPELVFLVFKKSQPLHLTTDGFYSLEKADICLWSQDLDAHHIVRLLQQLHSVKYLKLSWNIVEFLSSSVDLILNQPSPFVNLKSLKIYPESVTSWEKTPKKVAMSTELKDYLLGSTPGATCTMLLHEEVQAQLLMAELRVLLEKENDNYKTNIQGKTPVESHEPKKLKILGNTKQVKSGLENLVMQFQQRKEKAYLILSKLERIQELLTSLPASNRAKIQPSFTSLCAEANIVLSQIIECMKLCCDENRSLSNNTTLEPSS